MSAAPLQENLSKNEVDSSFNDTVETVPFGMVEEDTLCIAKVITSIVKDTDFAPSWKVVAKRMEIGADHVKSCRRNAKTTDEEIS